MMSSNEVDHTKVPIWVGKDCKIVSGINKSTTCQNVIQSLITDNPSKFVIVEKWKKMERRLDASVRILKVWKAWGDQKDDVALILRSHHANDGYIDKRISNKVPRRNKSSQLHKLTNQDENMEDGEGGGGGVVREPMERLLKLVLTQGETIQAQLKKLRHQEEQIERYEEEMHRIRSLKEGDNYVVESYLRDERGKKLRKRDKSPRKAGWLKQHHSLFNSNNNNNSHHHHHHHRPNHTHTSSSSKENGGGGSSGDSKMLDVIQSVIGTGTVQMRQEQCETTTTTDDTKCGDGEEGDEEYIREQSELMERICELNCKLTKEEETLVKLGLKIKKFYERHKEDQEHSSPQQQQQQQQMETNHKEEEEAEEGKEEEGGNNKNRKIGTNQLDDNPLGVNEDDNDNEDCQVQKIRMNPTSNNCSSCYGHKISHAEELELRQLVGQVELLRESTSEQFTEIAINEKSLNELETLLDTKHDHVAHLTFQIQQVDEEGEYLRQRLLKISQGFPPRPSYPHYNPLPPISSISPGTSSSFHPHPHVSLLAAQQQQQQLQLVQKQPMLVLPQQQHPPSSTVKSSSSSEDEILGLVVDKPQMINTQQHQLQHQQQQIIPCDSSTISSINFPCSVVPSSTEPNNTQLNLHIKPCRDHQDNDSNSDTGISSLHSSSDENTLFVLDTLV